MSARNFLSDDTTCLTEKPHKLLEQCIANITKMKNKTCFRALSQTDRSLICFHEGKTTFVRKERPHHLIFYLKDNNNNLTNNYQFLKDSSTKTCNVRHYSRIKFSKSVLTYFIFVDKTQTEMLGEMTAPITVHFNCNVTEEDIM